MAIYSGFTHEQWWFSIVMLVYQRINWWNALAHTKNRFRIVSKNTNQQDLKFLNRHTWCCIMLHPKYWFKEKHFNIGWLFKVYLEIQWKIGKSEKKTPQSWRMMEKKTSFFVLCRSQTHGSTAVAVSARPFGVRPRKVPPFHRWQPCEAEDQSPGVNIKDYFDVKQQQTSHIQP